MNDYERLRCFAILLVTDDKDLFCKAYEKLNNKGFSTTGNKNGKGIWYLVSDEFQKKQYQWKKEWKKQHDNKSKKN